MKSWNTIVPNTLIHDQAVSSEARFLYILLVSYASPSSPHPWPSRALLRTRTGWGRDRLVKYLKALEDSGWIKRHQRKSGTQWRSNRFILFKTLINQRNYREKLNDPRWMALRDQIL